MRSVFIFKKQADGSRVFAQRPIRKGISFEIAEEEMSFHVKRLEVRKILRIIPIEDEKPVVIAEPKLPPVILEPTIEVMEEAPAVVVEEVEKKSYKPRKKKRVVEEDKT